MFGVTHVLVLAVVGSFFVAFNNGANDVANAFASAVGSKALKIKHALMIAACLNFLGAVVMGSNVSKMLIDGIVNIGQFGDMRSYIAGMLACMVAAGSFIFLSTYTALPVSSTHAIVGGMMGISVVSGGVHAVNWRSLAVLVATWAVTPFFAAICSFVTIKLVRVTIYRGDRKDIMSRACQWIPIFASIIVLAVLMAVVHGTSLRGRIRPLHSLIAVAIIMPALYIVFRNFTCVLAKKFGNREFGIEHVFKRFQAGTSCLIGFAIGSNDVANSVTPVVAIYLVTKIGHLPDSFSDVTIPVWLLALGGVGMSTGVLSFGHKVIGTLGHGITVLTNSKGFAIDFATAMTIIIASVFGIPVSSTHASTGSVIGVGLEKGMRNVNAGVISKIFLTWLMTVPLSAVFTIAIFKIFCLVMQIFKIVP